MSKKSGNEIFRSNRLELVFYMYCFYIKMIDKKFLYAIVGASNNLEKYGYKVFKDFLDWWYKVIPINPKEQEILWQHVYPTLSSVDKKIDVVICVVPPNVTELVVDEVKKIWIKNIWMQPWSQNDISIQKCLDNWINCVHDACIMIERKNEKKFLCEKYKT